MILAAALPAPAFATEEQTTTQPATTIHGQVIREALKPAVLNQLRPAPQTHIGRGTAPRIKSLKRILIGAAIGVGLAGWLGASVYADKAPKALRYGVGSQNLGTLT